ncbi:NAD(P)-binding protein [Aspergillus homomorphus CBS 101889]|uniref:NAD(P)-binding protein n=1 Tax=Aspergillus homomorphus (strain CBS 101889) TaxID=1450537 RepID=A0A395HF54_ASPHC|nr:NAD(P)-binding protein [Aspergillus homomorphus CBS 101889]RAL06522.1 NAD(P)-binding protein [Aspergillus homomorphus CBS 101889]
MVDIQLTTGRALVSYGPSKDGGWKLRDVALRPIRVCQADLHFAGLESGHGVHYPRVMGHEGAGYVRQVGPGVTTAHVGDPALMSFSSCQTCRCCRRGHPAHCHNFDPINFESTCTDRVFWEEGATTPQTREPDIFGRFFGQSSFASWTIVQESAVINVAGMTGAGAVLNAAGARRDDTVAVLGLGGVGLSAVMGARIAGCQTIIGIARNEARLKLALELGATHVVRIDPDADLSLVTQAVRALTGGLGVDVTLETTGVLELVAEAVDMTVNKGKIVQLGAAPETATVIIPIHEFMVAGKVFMGVVEGDVVHREFVPKMIGFGKNFEEAIRNMKSGRTIKPILLW